MPDRDLDITKFSYRAYRKLKKTLGEFDAVVECNEIAIREFLEKAEGEDPRKYIQQLSSKHRVKVDEVDLIKFGSRIRQYYVTSVFQQSEQFLKDFKDEWIKYHTDNEWLAPKSGETNFQNCFKNTKIDIPSNLMDCYEYYRLVRNYMSHSDRDIKALTTSYKKVVNNGDGFLRDLKVVKSPNSLENINFDDFFILTNIVKHIAFLICNGSKPHNQRISEVLFELSKENKKAAYKGLKKLKNNEVRYDKALKSFTRTTFGRFSSSDIDEIVRDLKGLLA